jgi:hypothetical protein
LQHPFEDVHAESFLEPHDALLMTGTKEMMARQLIVEFTSIAL